MSNDTIAEPRRGFGYIPDIPDFRDQYFTITRPDLLSGEAMPPVVDLRNDEAMKWPVFDQGTIGSCTANAISGAVAWAYYKQKMAEIQNTNNKPLMPSPFFIASRLFIYYNERIAIKTTNSDSGAQLRDGIKSMNRYGACKEDPTWPYIPNKFADRPPTEAYKEASLHQALQYRRLDNSAPMQLKACLVQGFPFVFGFTVYQSFMSQLVAKTGIMVMPTKQEKVLGGHAVLGVGYDDNKKVVICRNSWGVGWGDKGHFYMPYAYVTNLDLSTDYWTITMMEQEQEMLK